MKVSAIIPNWNGAEKLRKNLPLVLGVDQVDEVIVVDDGSTDQSVQIVRSEFPEVKLVVKNQNSGFASTVNLGVQHSLGELVVLLNSDARPMRDFVKASLDHFRRPEVFSVGCNVGGAWAVGEFKDGFFWHHQASGEKGSLKKPHRTLWASGGSGIFRRDLWDLLRGFDELFDPFYEEDLDLGYRATKRGYINIWEPSSVVEHYKERGVIKSNFSKEFISRIAQRNQLLFIWKNITDPGLFRAHKEKLVRMLLTTPSYWRVFLSAAIKIGKISRKRELEKQQAKLSDQELLQLFV